VQRRLVGFNFFGGFAPSCGWRFRGLVELPVGSLTASRVGQRVVCSAGSSRCAILSSRPDLRDCCFSTTACVLIVQETAELCGCKAMKGRVFFWHKHHQSQQQQQQQIFFKNEQRRIEWVRLCVCICQALGVAGTNNYRNVLHLDLKKKTRSVFEFGISELAINSLLLIW